MTLYKEFHGEIPIDKIGKRLREIAKHNKSFKILTGYGSNTGNSESKNAAIRSLAKMKKEKIIKGFFPGEVKNKVDVNSRYSLDKSMFESKVKKDSDYGNEGIIFVFI